MLAYLLGNPERILSTATLVVTICSIITANTDTPAPETVLGKLYRIIEVLAIVIGKAKNKG